MNFKINSLSDQRNMLNEIDPRTLVNSCLREDANAQGTDGWLAARKGIITGSKLHSLVGASAFDTAEKARDKFWGSEKITPSPSMKMGTSAEGIIRDHLQKRMGIRFWETGLFVDDVRGLGTSPDGLYVNDDGQLGLLEIKWTMRHPFTVYTTPNETDILPIAHMRPEHYTQVQYSAGLLGASEITYAIFTHTSASMTIITMRTDPWDIYASLAVSLREKLINIGPK